MKVDTLQHDNKTLNSQLNDYSAILTPANSANSVDDRIKKSAAGDHAKEIEKAAHAVLQVYIHLSLSLCVCVCMCVLLDMLFCICIYTLDVKCGFYMDIHNPDNPNNPVITLYNRPRM